MIEALFQVPPTRLSKALGQAHMLFVRAEVRAQCILRSMAQLLKIVLWVLFIIVLAWGGGWWLFFF